VFFFFKSLTDLDVLRAASLGKKSSFEPISSSSGRELHGDIWLAGGVDLGFVSIGSGRKAAIMDFSGKSPASGSLRKVATD